MPFTTTWIDLECIMLSEISQIKMKKTILFYLDVESKKTKQMNKQKRLIDTENKLTVVGGLGSGGWAEK